MLESSEVIAFLATADAARARRVYEGRLGLRCVSDEPFALVFDHNGTMLRVQKVESVSVAPYTSLGWRVDDFAARVQDLTAAGVKFEVYEGMGQDELGVWSSPSGARVAWFKDPNGNTLSLTQF
jgi:catechol 2,3-dioxygenase-like lactoylglutathione lyase family enzyme